MYFFSGRLANGQASVCSASTSPTTYPVSAAQIHSAPCLQISAYRLRNNRRSALQRIVWGVAANDERLRLINLVLEPCAAALADLITGVFALATMPSKPNSLINGISSAGLYQAYLTIQEEYASLGRRLYHSAARV